MKKGNRNALLSLCVVVCICIVCFVVYMSLKEDENVDEISLDTLPEYSQNAYVTINDNEPDFEEYEITEAQTSFETYNQLDELGRCTMAKASVGKETMPKTDRESISSVKPSGWQNERYDFVPGGWVYNRCHLIGYQLTGENALYEVTPIYEGENLVASGVHMQACSVDDDCESLAFNVYAYNVQPGVEIDYATGENEKE